MSVEGCECFCERYIIENAEYIKLDYYYVGEVKWFDLWYRHAGDQIVYNTNGQWAMFEAGLAGMLTGGYLTQEQYNCGIVQFHYLDGDEATIRILSYLTDVYDRTESGNNYGLMKPIGEQIGHERLLLCQTMNSHFIECAYGNSLDMIASILNLSRETGETDEQFRARILAKVPGFIGGGTHDSIKAAVANFLGISVDDVQIQDGYLVMGAYGHFRVAIDISVTPGVGQTYQRLVELVNEVKAAGTVVDSAGFIITEAVNVGETFSFSVATNYVPETQSVSESPTASMFYHRTDITKTDSLNVVS